MIEAVEALGPDAGERQVTFIWSTEEEVGLKGAAAAAERMAKDGTSPDFVFAIDTFVSSDSPIESKRFADAEIGKGFVIRAVDNSNIAPREYVDRVVKLAQENKIPVQYGVTGGGNDGAVFVRYGAVDVPLSWPLRYSHSPGRGDRHARSGCAVKNCRGAGEKVVSQFRASEQLMSGLAVQDAAPGCDFLRKVGNGSQSEPNLPTRCASFFTMQLAQNVRLFLR